MWRVAFVLPGAWDNPADRALFDLFREELQKLGYLDGKNLVIDRRGAEGHNEGLFSLISELVALDPDVIVAVGAPPTDAARRATSTIPIVMWGTNDPVGRGLHQKSGPSRRKRDRRRRHVCRFHRQVG